MTIFYYFLQSLPESMGLIALSLALARVSLRWGQILTGGVIISVISYVIRILPTAFGFHIPIMIFIIFLLIITFTRVKLSHAAIAVFSSFFALALLEYLVSTAFFIITQMTTSEAYANESLWSYLGLFQSALLIGISVLISRFIKPVEGLWKN